MTANFWAIGLHAASWIAQFVGHGKFEGRAPALLDNLFQAFFLAPLFVWLEILFALGYRPDLQSRVNELVLQDVKKFRDSKQQKLDGTANGATNGHAKSF
jgi:2-hydroxy fatty acid dioxygenase